MRFVASPVTDFVDRLPERWWSRAPIGWVAALTLSLSSLASCGGDGDGNDMPSPQPNLPCETYKACGFLSDDELPICETTVADLDAPKALSECSECLAEKSCAAIADGICAGPCAQLQQALQPPGPSGIHSDTPLQELQASDREKLCTWYFTESGGENHAVTCGPSSVTTGDFSRCVENLLYVADFGTCAATVQTFEDCTLAVGEELCKMASELSCQALENCFPP